MGRLSLELAGELHILSLVWHGRLASRNLMCMRWVLLTAHISSRVACLPLQVALLSQESISLSSGRNESLNKRIVEHVFWIPASRPIVEEAVFFLSSAKVEFPQLLSCYPTAGMFIFKNFPIRRR